LPDRCPDRNAGLPYRNHKTGRASRKTPATICTAIRIYALGARAARPTPGWRRAAGPKPKETVGRSAQRTVERNRNRVRPDQSCSADYGSYAFRGQLVQRNFSPAASSIPEGLLSRRGVVPTRAGRRTPRRRPTASVQAAVNRFLCRPSRRSPEAHDHGGFRSLCGGLRCQLEIRVRSRWQYDCGCQR
jgi:hypothetical protein